MFMGVYKVNIADLVCCYGYCVFVGCFRMIVLKVFCPFATLVHHQLSRPFTLSALGWRLMIALYRFQLIIGPNLE